MQLFYCFQVAWRALCKGKLLFPMTLIKGLALFLWP